MSIYNEGYIGDAEVGSFQKERGGGKSQKGSRDIERQINS